MSQKLKKNTAIALGNFLSQFKAEGKLPKILRYKTMI